MRGDPFESLMFGDCGNFNWFTNRFWAHPISSILRSGLYAKASQVNGILNWHRR